MSAILRRSIWAAIAITLILPACGGSSKPPIVEVEGQSLLALGETVQIRADTSNGQDTAYIWTSSDPDVAEVIAGLASAAAPSSLVKGRAAGNAIIYATGNVSGLTGEFAMVVSAEPHVDVPYFEEWVDSPHNDVTSDAFRHWDDDGEIRESCARCHSTPGFMDFTGADGSTPGVVDQPAPLGTTVECIACHNPTQETIMEVEFPSGVVVDDLGREATCMTCHQGRSWKGDVDDTIAQYTPAGGDDDTILEHTDPTKTVGFINVHYFPAAATRWGGEVQGGYMYDEVDGEERKYDVLFKHVPGLERCQDCHNAHTQQIRLDVCASCHNISTMEDLKKIRMESSITRDYDGDGDLVEGVYWEIDGLLDKLYAALQAYCDEVVGKPIMYDSHSYPYFFNDNGGGANYGNRYVSFTGRSMRAAYNFQYGKKDPGAYAHNAKFVIQLLHDSIADLNTKLMTPIDMSAAKRDDVGHFNGTAEAFRYFDQYGEVRSSCARCHSANEGFQEYLTYGTNLTKDIANGFDCAVCHTTFDTFETRRIETVEFPGGYTTPPIPPAVPTTDPLVQTNTCITCHQGRTSKADIDEAIAGVEEDWTNNPSNDGDTNRTLGFMNVHYLAAGATLFGGDAKVGYQYEGKVYQGKFLHSGINANNNNCTSCHNPQRTKHTFNPDTEENKQFCNQCHAMPTNSLHDIRLNRPDDYDGDGDADEPLDEEIDGFRDNLWAAMRAYADTPGTGTEGQPRNGDPIAYHPSRYPYFFVDLNDNGEVDDNETGFGNWYRDWDGRLLKAAHNFQHSLKEPGAWAHNFYYIIQLMYDSIDDLGGSLSGPVDDFIVPDRP